MLPICYGKLGRWYDAMTQLRLAIAKRTDSIRYLLQDRDLGAIRARIQEEF